MNKRMWAHLGSWQGALVAVMLPSLVTCATLPVADAVKRPADVKPVAFEGTNGPVSAARSSAILERLEGADGVSNMLQRHLLSEQNINLDSPLVLGNRLVLLQDGPATYQAMFAAIRAANQSIHLETYIMDDDEIGQQFSELLLHKQAQGVQVNLIYDSVGCINTPQAFFDRLIGGGIQVVEFNPINPMNDNGNDWQLNNRDHRKLLIVDGRIAFVGGINISNAYSSNPFSRRAKKNRQQVGGWRDVHSQIEGPVVAEFQKLFVATWQKQNGPPLDHVMLYPVLAHAGDDIVRAIGSAANDPNSPIYLTLLSAFAHAERTINLTVAYFVPDAQLLQALIDAAGRGVSVTMILPSYTDSWLMFHLGRTHYEELLSAGVNIYQRRGAVMHAKTVSIDGVWSTIGSTNLDWRSFIHNDELNAVILGRDFGTQMDTMFAEELGESEVMVLKQWRERPWLDRFREWLAGFAAYWL